MIIIVYTSKHSIWYQMIERMKVDGTLIKMELDDFATVSDWITLAVKSQGLLLGALEEATHCVSFKLSIAFSTAKIYAVTEGSNLGTLWWRCVTSTSSSVLKSVMRDKKNAKKTLRVGICFPEITHFFRNAGIGSTTIPEFIPFHQAKHCSDL